METKIKDLQDLGRYLKHLKITPTEAFRIIQREVDTSDTKGPKVHWKLMRFNLYVWARIEEKKKTGKLGKRVNTIRALCKTDKYKRLFETFPNTIRGGSSFNYVREVKKLADLVSEPRQRKWFKKGLFNYENSKTNIPQSILDEVR